MRPTHAHRLLRPASIALALLAGTLVGCGEAPTPKPPPTVGGSTGMNPPPSELPDDGSHDAEVHHGPHAHEADEVGPPPVDVGPAVRRGPRGGVVARLSRADDPDFGWLELKLDVETGRLELWLARDADVTEPFDLPVDTVLALSFVDREGTRLELRVRDAVANVDVSGSPTVRDGKTHYFVFPPAEQTPPAWLRRAALREIVRLSLLHDRVAYVSDDFELRPSGDAKAPK